MLSKENSGFTFKLRIFCLFLVQTWKKEIVILSYAGVGLSGLDVVLVSGTFTNRAMLILLKAQLIANWQKRLV